MRFAAKETEKTMKLTLFCVFYCTYKKIYKLQTNIECQNDLPFFLACCDGISASFSNQLHQCHAMKCSCKVVLATNFLKFEPSTCTCHYTQWSTEHTKDTHRRRCPINQTKKIIYLFINSRSKRLLCHRCLLMCILQNQFWLLLDGLLNWCDGMVSIKGDRVDKI